MLSQVQQFPKKKKRESGGDLQTKRRVSLSHFSFEFFSEPCSRVVKRNKKRNGLPSFDQKIAKNRTTFIITRDRPIFRTTAAFLPRLRRQESRTRTSTNAIDPGSRKKKRKKKNEKIAHRSSISPPPLRRHRDRNHPRFHHRDSIPSSNHPAGRDDVRIDRD